jgi:hypothetical protein
MWQVSKYHYTLPMILFINPISKNITLALLEDWIQKEVINIIKGDDFSTFPDKVVEIVDLYNITEIWCLCGPGAFTRMRIVTLTLNTLVISRRIYLKWCHFFDIITDGRSPILRANDTEYIIGRAHEYNLIEKDFIPSGSYSWYADQNDFTEDKVWIQYNEDYAEITRIFENIESSSRLSPIYLKDPHITWSKKNISPS